MSFATTLSTTRRRKWCILRLIRATVVSGKVSWLSTLMTASCTGRGAIVLGCPPWSIQAVLVVEADEAQHRTASVLGLLVERHCAESTLYVSEQANLKMGQHLESASERLLVLSSGNFSFWKGFADRVSQSLRNQGGKCILQMSGCSPSRNFSCLYVRRWDSHLQHSEIRSRNSL